MEFNVYAMKYFLCILRIELKYEKHINPPSGGPEWLDNLISYLFSEYANSRDELYEVGLAFSASTKFEELKEKLSDLLSSPDMPWIKIKK